MIFVGNPEPGTVNPEPYKLDHVIIGKAWFSFFERNMNGEI